MPTRVALSCLVALFGLAWPVDAQEQSLDPAVGGRPLLDWLRDQAANAPVDLRIDPAVSGQLVEVSVDGLDAESAIKRALLASGVDFVMAWKGRRLQVLAGDLRAAVEVSRGAAGVAAPFGPEPRAANWQDEAETSRQTDAAPAPSPGPEMDAGATSDDAPQTPGEGTVSGAQMLVLLAMPAANAAPQAPFVDLPFPDATGQPVRVTRPAETPGVVQLPFTDETGQPVMHITPVRPPGPIELPFPDEFGRPIRLAPTAAPPRKLPPGDN